MELGIAFLVFIVSMVGAIIFDLTMIAPLLVGLAAFLIVGVRKGFSLKEMARMGWSSVKKSSAVIQIMAIIGLITATWRICGTITIFVYYGMKVITPHLFLMITFLLSCLLSYALGTSFGVSGTVGVIFMALARSGGVNPAVTAGVVMSGVYFGDRCSPVSSSANLVASVTDTDILENVKLMTKTAVFPYALTLLVYAGLSYRNPITYLDEAVVKAFEEAFVLSLWSFVPAVLMLVLPLFKVRVKHAMLASIASGFVVACAVQGVPLGEVLHAAIFGYRASGDGLGTILNGGGLVSMLEVVGILLISNSYSGIFSGTNMLHDLQDMLGRACTKLGLFAVTTLMSLAMLAVFCNQTISTLMCGELMRKPYLDCGGTKEELAIDMENSVIPLVGIVPWAIGCSVPLAFMDADYTALPYAFYIFALPICYWLTKKKWFGAR